MSLVRLQGVLLFAFTVSACAARSSAPGAFQMPEQPTTYRTVGPSRAQSFMVSTANPEATKAAVQIIEAGGNAVDAAVAAQLVLTVTEPQSSGIGGGSFLLYYDASTQGLTAYDGREKAPAAMKPTAFLGKDGTPRPFFEALTGGLAVGVPGTLAALERAHSENGVLSWPKLFEPAIKLAKDGWTVHPRLENALKTVPHLVKYAGQNSMFFNAAGTPRKAGERVTNPKLAATLERLAAQGIDPFYQGPIGAEIVRVVQQSENPGAMTAEDLAAYQPEVRPAHCESYRAYRVCGFPPPAGAVVGLTMLKLLEPFDIPSMEPNGADFYHLYAQASEIAYADRDAYYADPEFAEVPVAALLDGDRLEAGSKLIRTDPRAQTVLQMPALDVAAGDSEVCPAGAAAQRLEVENERPSTSHVSIMDREGNVVSMTSSVEFNFGSSTMAGGFVLNNQLTDFEFSPCTDGGLKANAVEPSKRPRSSMSPTIVLDERNRPVLAVGSPGGAAIISFTVQTIIGVLDWGLDPQDAVAAPRLVARKGKTVLESHPDLDSRIPARLKALGHDLLVRPLTSGLSVVQKTADGYAGGADPRRDGLAAGD